MLKRNTLIVVFLIGFAFVSRSQMVGIGTTTPDSSALLEIKTTTKGLLLPRLSTGQRDKIISPVQGLSIYNVSTNCIDYYTGVQWLSLCGVPVTYFRNCKQIKSSNPTLPSGVYNIDIDSLGDMKPVSCYCDMTTDGGGWTMVLNYNHKANTDPELSIRSNTLPLLGSTSLGVDESTTDYWGQASNTLLSQFNFSEIRLFAVTSDHNRTINFKTSHAGTLNYFKTGLGSCSGIQSSFTPLAGHSAFLPAASIDFLSNAGEIAADKYPFFVACNYHWAIKGETGGQTAHRWEVDNTLCTGCCAQVQGFTKDTRHQMWIR